MTGEALFETMAGQVEAECGQHLADARREAEVILAEARKKGEATRDSTLSATHCEMENLKERWRLKAEAEAAKAELMVRKEIVDSVLSRIENEIRSIAEATNFVTILDALMDELMNAVDDDVVLLAPKAHAKHVEKWLADNNHGKVKVEASSSQWDGVAAQDAERSYRVSNALTGRFRRMEQSIRKESMAALFGR